MCRIFGITPERRRHHGVDIQTDPSPLRVDEHGVIRVGDSQVLLDVLIQEFNNGAEPEDVAHGYPTLNLALYQQWP
jgi:hypothetical protein